MGLWPEWLKVLSATSGRREINVNALADWLKGLPKFACWEHGHSWSLFASKLGRQFEKLWRTTRSNNLADILTLNIVHKQPCVKLQF